MPGSSEPLAAATTTTTTRQSLDNVPPLPTETYPAGLKLVAITIGLTLSIFLAALDSTIIATAIPSITAQFGSIRNIAWYGSAYQVTNTALQPVWGKAYRLFPLKSVFLLAVATFELGNVVCATAPDSSVVILGRVVAGTGGGGIMTGAFIMIALSVRPRYRPAFMGIFSVTFGCASVVGPLMGGALTDGLGWRWCFWISLPIGTVAAFMVWAFFSQPASANPPPEVLASKVMQLDLVGAALATGALSCFVMAMHWAGTLPWNSKEVVGTLLGFAGLSSVFGINEWLMGAKAMIQPHFLRKKPVLLNLAYIFFLAGAYEPLLYTLPVQFQALDNDSATQSGIRLIPLILGISVFTMVSNGFLTVWRHYNPLLVFSAVVGTAGIVMIYTIEAGASKTTWAGFEIVTAIGVGIALQVPMISNQGLVANDDISGVTTLSLFIENLGTVLSVAASEAAFTTGLVSSLREHAPAVDPAVVIDAGVTQLRVIFSHPSELSAILMAYFYGCKISHIISVFCGAAAAFVSLVSAWPAAQRVMQGRLQRSHAA